MRYVLHFSVFTFFWVILYQLSRYNVSSDRNGGESMLFLSDALKTSKDDMRWEIEFLDPDNTAIIPLCGNVEELRDALIFRLETMADTDDLNKERANGFEEA